MYSLLSGSMFAGIASPCLCLYVCVCVCACSRARACVCGACVYVYVCVRACEHQISFHPKASLSSSISLTTWHLTAANLQVPPPPSKHTPIRHTDLREGRRRGEKGGD